MHFSLRAGGPAQSGSSWTSIKVLLQVLLEKMNGENDLFYTVNQIRIGWFCQNIETWKKFGLSIKCFRALEADSNWN